MNNTPMTFRELADLILASSPDVQNQTATVFVPGIDEYYPAAVSYTDEECDVLDSGHMVITIR